MPDNRDNDLHSKIDRLADSQEKQFQKTHQSQRDQKAHGVTNFAMNILQASQNKMIGNTQKEVIALDAQETQRWEKQKKHNRGAKNARERILDTQDEMMALMRRGGGSGGGPGGGGSGGGGSARGNRGGANWGNNDAGGPWGPVSGLSGGGRTSNVVDQTGFVDASKIKKAPVAGEISKTGFLGRRGEQVDVQGRIINERLVGGRRGPGAALRGLRGELIDQRLAGMDNQWATNEKGMRKLTLGGREMARAEVGKDGKTRYRDERTGFFAKEEKFQQSERRKGLFETALDSTAANTQYQRRASGYGIQKQREVMGSALKKNAGAIQAIVEDNPALAAEMKQLEELQSKAQGLRGDEGREARQKVSEQLGRIKSIDKTGQMDSLLDVKGQRKALESGSGLKDMFNIDQDAGLLQGTKQFFGIGKDWNRLWGDAGTGGLTNLYSQKTKDRLADERGALSAGMDTQQSALELATGKDMLRLTGGDIFEHDPRKGDNLSPAAPTLGEQVAQESQQGKAKAPVRGKATAGAGGKFTSGTDAEGIQHKQLEELVKIREVLEQGGFGGGGDGGGGGLFGGWKSGGKKGGRVSRFLGKHGGKLAKAGGVLAVGAGLYTAGKGIMSANQAEDEGTIGAEEAQQQRAEATGEGLGGAAGAIGGMKGGAALGAAIGSVVPGVGTAIGAFVGGAIGGIAGWYAGSWAGKKVGGAVGDVLDVPEEELKKSENINRVMLEKIEGRDSSLAGRIKQRAAEKESELLASVADPDILSDRDKMAIKNAAMASAISEHKEQIDAIGIDRAALADAVEEKTEAGFESAKDSGLYDHDWLGKSELDHSKLGDATEDQLQAIVQHGDLSDEDMAAVEGKLKEIRQAPIIEKKKRDAEMTALYKDADAVKKHNISVDYQLADEQRKAGIEAQAAHKEKYGDFDASEEKWDEHLQDSYTRDYYSDPEIQAKWDQARSLERHGEIGMRDAKHAYMEHVDNISHQDRERGMGAMADLKMGRGLKNRGNIRGLEIDPNNPWEGWVGKDAGYLMSMKVDGTPYSTQGVTDRYHASIEQEMRGVSGGHRKSKLAQIFEGTSSQYDDQGYKLPVQHDWSKFGPSVGSGFGKGNKDEGLLKNAWKKSMMGRAAEWVLPGDDGKGMLVNAKDMVMGASGAALGFMGDSTSLSADASPVINNITNNNGPATPPENLLIAPGTVRTSDSTIQRYQDMRYTG
tara:strand:- start:260 stop:3883 length:3624 start_codon:yes stop_codon:yes gene_type:complete